jgi:hypothetical protein
LDANGKAMDFKLSDVAALESYIRASGARRAHALIDPIQSFIGSKVDIHRSNETRPVLDALAALCKRMAVEGISLTITIVRHDRKNHSGHAMEGALGSIDIVATMRSDNAFGEVTTRAPGTPKQGLLVPVKANNKWGLPLLFEIFESKNPALVDEDGDPVSAAEVKCLGLCGLTINDLAAPKNGNDKKTITVQEKATDWLKSALDDMEPHPASELFSDWAENSGKDLTEGVKRQLQRAKAALHVIATDGAAKDITWRLPKPEELPKFHADRRKGALSGCGVSGHTDAAPTEHDETEDEEAAPESSTGASTATKTAQKRAAKSVPAKKARRKR